MFTYSLKWAPSTQHSISNMHFASPARLGENPGRGGTERGEEGGLFRRVCGGSCSRMGESTESKQRVDEEEADALP